jgi:hemolysin III
MTGPEEDASHLGLRHRRVSHTDYTTHAASSFSSRHHNRGAVLPLSMRLMRPLLQNNNCSDCCANIGTNTNTTTRQQQNEEPMTYPPDAYCPDCSNTNITSNNNNNDNGKKAISIESILIEYSTYCHIYGIPHRLNPGVLTALRYSLPTIRVTGNFFDVDMLALVELLLHHCNGALRHVRRLDFTIASRSSGSGSGISYYPTNSSGNEGGIPSTNGGGGKRGIRSHGAYALSRVLLISNYIEEVYLVGNRIGPYGASAIFDAIASNNNNNNSMNNKGNGASGGSGSAVKTLLLRGCRIGERGALAFVNRILVNELECNKLRIVDLSACRMGFRGTYAIEARLRELSERTIKHVIRSYSTLSTLHDEFNAMVVDGSNSLDDNYTFTINGTNEVEKVMMIVDLEGNLVYQEVMNCVTHGLGTILGTVGQLLLNRQIVGQPWYYIVSCAIYSTSVITLYMSSTLFHSFFALRRVKFIFGVFDKCAIYLLIAGSYTPFLMIGLHHKQSISMKLLLFIWGCAISGIFVEMFYHSWKYKSNFSLAMYLGMGWCCLTCMPDIVEVLPRNALVLLVAGGVSYTGGVPFFIRNTNLDHSIWHMFVLAGKKCFLFV